MMRIMQANRSTPSANADEFYRQLTQAGMSARKADVVVKHATKLARAKTPAQLRVLTQAYIEAMTQVGFTERQARIIAEFRAGIVRCCIKPTRRIDRRERTLSH